MDCVAACGKNHNRFQVDTAHDPETKEPNLRECFSQILDDERAFGVLELELCRTHCFSLLLILSAK